MTKKNLLSPVLFIIGFIVTYLALCYLIPGLRIKLSAEPIEYFTESIKHAILLKTIISAIVGLLIGSIPILAKSRTE